MKVEQIKQFDPIVITLESEDEAVRFKSILCATSTNHPVTANMINDLVFALNGGVL